MQLEEFLTSDVFLAFVADGVNESHPIIQTVSNPDEINELFDSISYSKVSGWVWVDECSTVEPSVMTQLK